MGRDNDKIYVSSPLSLATELNGIFLPGKNALIILKTGPNFIDILYLQ